MQKKNMKKEEVKLGQNSIRKQASGVARILEPELL